MRFHSAPVVRLADAKPMQLGHCRPRRWRLADLRLCRCAARAIRRTTARAVRAPRAVADSPIRRFTPDRRRHRQRHRRSRGVPAGPPRPQGRGAAVAAAAAQGPLRADRLREGLRPDWTTGADDIFDLRGIDREQGALVVVRPDQYVANVLPLDAFDELDAYFAPLLLNA